MFLIHLQEASQAHFNKKNTSVVNLPTFYIHVMGFSSDFYQPKDPPRFRFTTTWPFEVLIARPWGGSLSLASWIQVDPCRFDVSGERPMNARLSMMMEVMRPLVPFDPWRLTFVAVENPPAFPPPKKNTRDVCLTPKTEMKVGIWKKWWCRGKGNMHMHCGRSWSFDSSRYIATILWVFA